MSQSLSKKIGLTPAKGVLMGVLGIAFIAVWAPQFMRSSVPLAADTPAGVSSEQRTPPRRPPSRTTPTGGPKASFVTIAPPRGTEAPLPTSKGPEVIVELDDAVRHDPFSLPNWAPGAENKAEFTHVEEGGSDHEMRADQLRSSGAEMLLISEQGNAANINGRTVRVGDTFDGFRVHEITQSGVFLVPIEAEDAL